MRKAAAAAREIGHPPPVKGTVADPTPALYPNRNPVHHRNPTTPPIPPPIGAEGATVTGAAAADGALRRIPAARGIERRARGKSRMKR